MEGFPGFPGIAGQKTYFRQCRFVRLGRSQYVRVPMVIRMSLTSTAFRIVIDMWQWLQGDWSFPIGSVQA